MTLPAAAQTPIIPLNTLVANHGSVTAGDVSFSNFQKPTTLPRQVGVLLPEFNDVGISAVFNADGTISLNFVGIDPVTGLTSPFVVGAAAAAGGDLLRLVSYTATVTNPARRLHSVTQGWGPATNTASGGGFSWGFNYLFGVEPNLVAGGFGPFVDPLRDDDFATFAAGFLYDTLLPGGNLPSYTMENEFGLLKGHIGTPSGGSMDYLGITFTLVPAGTPAPLVITNLPQAGDPGVWGGLTSSGFVIEPNSGILQFILTTYAQDGGAPITLTSNNPAALTVPSTVTIAQGSYISQPVFLGPTNVDFPTLVTLTASFNGRVQTNDFTAKPAIPLAIASLSAGTPTCGGVPCTLNTGMRVNLQMNRANVTPVTLALTSSNPAICPIPATLALAAFTPVGAIPSIALTCKPVAVDTPITYTAMLNGVSSSTTGMFYKTTDFVAITKAELVVKNLSLKVDATNQVPSDTLTLYNAATGQFIGNMTFTGLTGTNGKFSFQGTAPGPVTTLLLKSELNGSTTFAVAQK